MSCHAWQGIYMAKVNNDVLYSLAVSITCNDDVSPVSTASITCNDDVSPISPTSLRCCSSHMIFVLHT